MSNTLVGAKKASTTVTILVSEELRDELARAAKENKRSLGAEVRVALRRHLHPEQREEGDE